MGKVSKALGKTNVEEITPSLYPEKNAITSRQHPSPPSPEKSAPAPPTKVLTESWDERLEFATEKHSSIAESIRKLRTRILYPDGGEKISSVMVSSSAPEEGKSFICANLGISLAQSMERHALMVDCDLRRPSLQSLFGLDMIQGLTNYLSFGAEIGKLIAPTGLDKLSIIAAGPLPENPAELISSEKMAGLLDEITNRYDDRLILLDCPPFHAAAETVVLSQLVDKVVLVVRWDKSSREEIKKVVDTIGKEKILGVVFNAYETSFLDRKLQGTGYNNYYTETYY